MTRPDEPVSLDRYLDRQLTPEQQASFERDEAPALAEQIELQSRIDASLRDRLNPPRIQVDWRAAGAGRSGAGSRIAKGFALAAVLALAALGGYLLWFAPQRAPFDQPEQIYTQIVSGGFEPAVECRTDEQFIEWMRRNHDSAVLIPASTPGIELVGWDYKRALTTRTSVLLARVRPDADTPGVEVIVLIDDLSEARRLFVPEGSGLRVHRRTLGDVVLYEVTPLDRPRLIAHARMPG